MPWPGGLQETPERGSEPPHGSAIHYLLSSIYWRHRGDRSTADNLVNALHFPAWPAVFQPKWQSIAPYSIHHLAPDRSNASMTLRGLAADAQGWLWHGAAGWPGISLEDWQRDERSFIWAFPLCAQKLFSSSGPGPRSLPVLYFPWILMKAKQLSSFLQLKINTFHKNSSKRIHKHSGIFPSGIFLWFLYCVGFLPLALM